MQKIVKSVADLKGTTVNGADSGSSPRAFVRAVVNNAGLDADNDVTYANMSNSAVIAALEMWRNQSYLCITRVKSTVN